jgi:hypothetical protein
MSDWVLFIPSAPLAHPTQANQQFCDGRHSVEGRPWLWSSHQNRIAALSDDAGWMEKIMSNNKDTEKTRELTEDELDAVAAGGRIKFNDFVIKRTTDGGRT